VAAITSWSSSRLAPLKARHLPAGYDDGSTVTLPNEHHLATPELLAEPSMLDWGGKRWWSVVV